MVSAAPAAAKVTSPQVVSPSGMVVQQSAVGAGGGRTAVVMFGFTGSGKKMQWFGAPAAPSLRFAPYRRGW